MRLKTSKNNKFQVCYNLQVVYSSDVGKGVGGGWGLDPLCGKCDIIVSYIKTNTVLQNLYFIYPI